MRKVWIVILLGVVVVGKLAFADYGAQSQIGSKDESLTTTTCSNRDSAGIGCNNVLPARTWVKGFKLHAEAAGQCALYDATTVPTGSTNHLTGLKDEILEATAGDGALHMWPSPMLFATGVSIAVTGSNNACTVYY